MYGDGGSGRRPGKNDAKDDIIVAARKSFGALGYVRATIRSIATDAKVDPALVMHYFGNKQRLFVESMVPLLRVSDRLAPVVAGDKATLGERMARFYVGMLEHKTTNLIITGLVRAASSEPHAAEILKRILIRSAMRTVKAVTGIPDAELRINLAASQLIGVVMVRYIVKVEPLASITPDDLVMYLAPTLQRYMTGDLNELTKKG